MHLNVNSIIQSERFAHVDLKATIASPQHLPSGQETLTSLDRTERIALAELLTHRVMPGVGLRKNTRKLAVGDCRCDYTTVFSGDAGEKISPVFYRMGDFFMVPNHRMPVLTEQNATHYLGAVADSLRHMRHQLFDGVGPENRKKFSDHVLICGKESAVPKDPFNIYSAYMITAMLRNREAFKNSIVIDAGCGENPVLSLAAGYRLQCPYVVMLEDTMYRLGMANRYVMHQGQEASNQQRSPDYRLLNCNLTDAQQMQTLTDRLRELDCRIIVLVNIGPWSFYGKANEMALEYFGSLPNLNLLLNSGYSFCDNVDHSAEFIVEKKRLERKGCRVLAHTYQDGIGLLEVHGPQSPRYREAA